jgi:hypothetical protein
VQIAITAAVPRRIAFGDHNFDVMGELRIRVVGRDLGLPTVSLLRLMKDIGTNPEKGVPFGPMRVDGPAPS